jgi:hypothetical protein
VQLDNGTRFMRRALIEPSGRLLLLNRLLGWAQGASSEPEVLLENMAFLTFTYFPCPSLSRDEGGHRWTDPLTLSFMVSIEATFRQGDPRYWRAVSAFLPASACMGTL